MATPRPGLCPLSVSPSAVSTAPDTRRRKTSGFTLLEVIIALAIFAMMTSALISISNSLNIVGALRSYQTSAWVADNHLEYARIAGLEENVTYTSTLFGVEYFSRIKTLEEPFKEIFNPDTEISGKLVGSVSSPTCTQVWVNVYREYAADPEFTMLGCIFPR